MRKELLIHLAKKGPTKISTTKLAQELGTSQQSISRLLKELENENYIERESFYDGSNITITNKTRKLLKEEYETLKAIFEKQNTIRGEVITGLGQGAYYVERYLPMIKETLGYEPFHGTLNVKVDNYKREEFLSCIVAEKIKGFTDNNRSYGAVYMYPVYVKGVKGAVLVPERTNHKEDILELVGPLHFKTKKIKKGDKIEIKK